MKIYELFQRIILQVLHRQLAISRCVDVEKKMIVVKWQ